MYKGVNRKLQIGVETTYGSLAAMDTVLNYTSESLKVTADKKEEETLLVSKFAKAFSLNGLSVAGDTELILKPENLNTLKYGFYEAAAPVAVVADSVFKHTLVAIPQGTDQSSASILVDRGASVIGYTGLILSSLKLEGKAGEPIKATFSWKGQKELDAQALETTLVNPSLSSFMTFGGSLAVNGIDINGLVQSATVEIDLGLDDPGKTQGSGLYSLEPLHGEKTGSFDISVYWDDDIDTIRTALAKADAYGSVVLAWQSSALIATGYPYKLQITCPKVSVSDCSPSISSKDRMTAKISGKVTEYGDCEPITIETWDARSTKY